MHNYACRFGAPSNSPKGGREGWRRFKAGNLSGNHTSHFSLITWETPKLPKILRI